LLLRSHTQSKIAVFFHSLQGPPLQIPWASILLSRPFWGVLLASQGVMWGTITLSMQLPAYFKSVHMLDIRTVSIDAQTTRNLNIILIRLHSHG